MGITFNAFEIFEMAEQLERNGANFYRRAAEEMSDRNNREMLLKVAEMEVEHEKTFAEMRKQILHKEATFDPDNEMALYLQTMASGYVFDLRKDISEQLTGKETVEDILKMAIQAEKDSIVFYLGIKDFVPDETGKQKVDDIIREEMGHITVLNRHLAESKQ